MPLLMLLALAAGGAFLLLRKSTPAVASPPTPAQIDQIVDLDTGTDGTAIVTDPATVQGAQTLLNVYAYNENITPVVVNGDPTDPSFISLLENFQASMDAEGDLTKAGFTFSSIRTDGVLDGNTFAVLADYAQMMAPPVPGALPPAAPPAPTGPVTTWTPVPDNGGSYALTQGATYRAVVSAPSKYTKASILSHLPGEGFANAQLWYTDQEPIPTDWPAGSWQPAEAGDRIIYGQATWSESTGPEKDSAHGLASIVVSYKILAVWQQVIS